MKQGAGGPGRSGLGMVLAVNVLCASGVFAIRPTLSYRTVELGLGLVWIGVVGSAYAVSALVSAPVLGHLADRWRQRTSAVVGTGTMVASGCILCVADGLTAMLIGSVLLGVGHFLALVGLQMAASGIGFAQGRMHGVFGVFALTSSLGQVLGPGLVAVIGGDSVVPPTTVVLVSATAVMAVMPLLASRLPEGSGARGQRTGSWCAVLRTPGLLGVVLISGLVVAAIDLTAIYLPLLGAERQLTSAFVASLMAVRAASAMVVRLVLDRWIGRFGARAVLLAALTSSTIAMAMLPLPVPGWVLVGLVVVVGMGLGVGDPVTAVWAAVKSPVGAQGRALSYRLMANRVGQIAIPVAAGALVPIAGVGAGFWLVSGGLVGAIGVASRVHTE